MVVTAAPVPLTLPHAIVVSGLRSGIGKTLLAERIVLAAPDVAAIKCTVREGPVVVTGDDHVLMVPGKDTWRLKQSGARPVIWVQTPETAVAGALREALRLVQEAARIVIEGNSVVRFVSPAAAIFICDSGILSGPVKPSRGEALARATVIIHNVREGTAADTKAVEAFCRARNPHAQLHAVNLADTAATSQVLGPILSSAGFR